MNLLSNIDSLMRLRRTHALTAEAVQGLTAVLEPPLTGPALFVQAPHWLAAALDGKATRRRQQLVFLEPRDQSDPLLLLVMQANSAQLRVLLHLNDPQVQHLLRHALSCNLLTTLVCAEHAPLATGLTTPLEGAARAKLSSLLDAVQGVAGDLGRALQVAAQFTEPGDLPSVFGDVAVTDVVSALVASDVDELTDEDVTNLTEESLSTRQKLH